MSTGNPLIDPYVKDVIKRYPTIELIRALYPDVRVSGRNACCNPLRNDQHASLSWFRNSDTGFYMWKDWATGEKGDNIEFYKKAFPRQGYLEVMDGLSRIILGRGIIPDRSSYRQARTPLPDQERPIPRTKGDSYPSIRVESAVPLVAGVVPDQYVRYARSRGISDEVFSRYLSYIRYTNLNKGPQNMIAPGSGLPVVDKSGMPVRQDPVHGAVGFLNELGGYAIRTVDLPGRKGIKLNDYAFFSVITSYGTAPCRTVSFRGQGPGIVERVFVNPSNGDVHINVTQKFSGIAPFAIPCAVSYLEGMRGRRLAQRELHNVTAVLNTLGAVTSSRVQVVEGMFDAMSLIELSKMSGNGPFPSSDIVVLNSTSHASLAVPYLSLHREVVSMLDNDVRSRAGEKASMAMLGEVAALSSKMGFPCLCSDGSGLFAGYKDVNDYLVAIKSGGNPPGGPGDGPGVAVTDALESRMNGRVPAEVRRTGKDTSNNTTNTVIQQIKI
jgi:hypothetical protein